MNLLTEISLMNFIIGGRLRWTKGLSAVIKFSFTLNSTKLAMFWVVFVTSFSVLSAVGLGGSDEIKGNWYSTDREAHNKQYLRQGQIVEA